jgi:hydrogenase maturation protein HypF
MIEVNEPGHRAAKHVVLRGHVQSVGFRPFVRNLTTEHHLVGWVRHTGADVEIEAEGPSYDLAAFLAELVSRAPSGTTVDNIIVRDSTTSTKGHFAILESVCAPDA